MDRQDPTPSPTEIAATQAGDTVTVGDHKGASRPSSARIITADRYRHTGDIGAGGMGEVIAAHDEQIGREVAIKRMRAKDPSERAVGRFMREARIQGRLEHPAIPPVHELGRGADGLPYFAMKKLQGVTLSKILEREGETPAFTRQRLLRAFCEVCLAIEFAHTRGVLHRDIKPDNIMLGEFGEVYVLDWGVAKLLGDALDADDGYEGSDSARNATAAGSAIGTPGYMSPEQVAGDPNIDVRSDVYALGCVLFEILAGDSLHPHGPAGMMSAVEGKDGRPSQRTPSRDIPPELDALCAAATSTRRDHRMATARELGDGVQRYLDGDRDLAMRAGLAIRHQQAASEAFAAGDRSTTMREAARALALDPEQTASAHLITTLMLEPPRDEPPAVQRALARDADQILVDHARFAFYGYFGILMFVPIVFAAAPLADGLIFLATALAAMAVAWFASRGRAVPIQLFALSSAAVIAAIAHVFSPIAFPQAPAAVIGLVLVMNPKFKPWPRAIVLGAMLGACGLPALGEVLGVLPRTFAIDDDGIRLFGAALHGGHVITSIALIASTAATVIVAILVGYGIRLQDGEARRRMHLQAWQLRQLVPDTVA